MTQGTLTLSKVSAANITVLVHAGNVNMRQHTIAKWGNIGKLLMTYDLCKLKEFWNMFPVSIDFFNIRKRTAIACLLHYTV